jgi:hypothetical protein
VAATCPPKVSAWRTKWRIRRPGASRGNWAHPHPWASFGIPTPDAPQHERDSPAPPTRWRCVPNAASIRVPRCTLPTARAIPRTNAAAVGGDGLSMRER